jgi:acetoin utilization protein AcuB
MTSPVITVQPGVPIQEALEMMRRKRVRRLPVVDEQGQLMGIISEKDLLNASPPDATNLSIWELQYLLTKIKVSQVMTREVISVGEDTPIEEAARIMVDHKIGGLPVIRGHEIVGIVTETDVFRVFLEMLGARSAGVRASVLIANQPGTLAALTKAVYGSGGNILALSTFLGESRSSSLITFKVEGVSLDQLREAVRPSVVRIVDMRETKGA